MDSRKMNINDGDIESPIVMPNGSTKYNFNHAAALGILFINGVVFMKDNETTAHVPSGNCFAKGENTNVTVYTDKIELLYVLWKRDPVFGPSAWLINEQVQDLTPSLEAVMITAGYDINFIRSAYKDTIVEWVRTGIKPY